MIRHVEGVISYFPKRFVLRQMQQMRPIAKSSVAVLMLKYSTWTYKPTSGKCYTLISDTARYALDDAQTLCKNVLRDYPKVEVNVAEIHDENDFQVLLDLLVNLSLEDKVVLNAKRQIKDCSDLPAGFDEDIMEFQPTMPHVGTTTVISCKVGFQPKATNSGNLKSNQFKCAGQRDQSSRADPSKYVAKFVQTITDLVKCEAIRCNESEMMAMIPKQATIAGARSRLTEEEFGPTQQNTFSQYGNVVTYKCEESYFYPDHTVEKFITCTLKENSNTEVEWKGYSGTSLPLPSECEPVECQYENALLKDQYNILENFTIDFENGTSLETNQLETVTYPYKATIRYVCKDGFETLTKKQDQNLTCGPLGKWVPQLKTCTEIEEEMTVSYTGRYVPQLVEAPSADQLGLILTIIVVIFFVCLLLLDLATFRRDIGHFVNNIRLQKRLWQAKKRLRDAKQRAKTHQCKE
ncbi:hypothetical protein Aperf_G00000093873 [Anoplocephala perfoliata]